jgi:hypothetical protein
MEPINEPINEPVEELEAVENDFINELVQKYKKEPKKTPKKKVWDESYVASPQRLEHLKGAREKAFEKRKQNKIDRENTKLQAIKDEREKEIEERVQQVLGKLELDKVRKIPAKKKEEIVEKPVEIVEKPVEKTIKEPIKEPIEPPKKTRSQIAGDNFAIHIQNIQNQMFRRNR